MRIGRVVGNVLATIKHPALFGHRLLLVDYEGADGELAGRPRLALDAVDSGEGDRVLVVDEGNAAAQVMARGRGPVRTVIVGVVDEVESFPGPPPGQRSGEHHRRRRA
jgi:ethanolamine utilization protein EutN